jgi:hypothetical protein
LEFEFPIQVAPLPARSVQAGHHRLRERVHRHFVDPFCESLAPFPAVFGEKFFHGVAIHGMPAVMAMANAIGTFDCGETHALIDRIL